jgi:hypothetical protein
MALRVQLGACKTLPKRSPNWHELHPKFSGQHIWADCTKIRRLPVTKIDQAFGHPLMSWSDYSAARRPLDSDADANVSLALRALRVTWPLIQA